MTEIAEESVNGLNIYLYGKGGRWIRASLEDQFAHL